MNQNEPKYLISACLVGCHCRYDGKNQSREAMVELHQTGQALVVCPEELGGLPTPRPPCEIKNSKVISINGEDKTEAYILGATEALKLAKTYSIKTAYLKSKSPMCGLGKIYDGSFTGTITPGDGVFASLLKKNDFKIEVID